MNIKLRNKLKGFTLLELIVVIAIISVLMMIAVPSIGTYVRDSKATAANTRAQQIYLAAQDYLTYLETHGEKAEDYFGCNTDNIGYIGIEYSIKDSRAAGTDGPCSSGDIMMNGASDINKALEAANQIMDRFTGDNEGAFIVAVYPKTFTVKYVVCSQEKNKSTLNPDKYTYNWIAVEAVGSPTLGGNHLYITYGTDKTSQATFGVGDGINGSPIKETVEHTNAQEYDNLHFPTVKFTGQYPIPAQ